DGAGAGPARRRRRRGARRLPPRGPPAGAPGGGGCHGRRRLLQREPGVPAGRPRRRRRAAPDRPARRRPGRHVGVGASVGTGPPPGGRLGRRGGRRIPGAGPGERGRRGRSPRPGYAGRCSPALQRPPGTGRGAAGPGPGGRRGPDQGVTGDGDGPGGGCAPGRARHDGGNGVVKMEPVVYAALTSFALVLLSGPLVIPALRRLRMGQVIREQGPARHLAKAGTPTMGGLLFVGACVAASAWFAPRTPTLWVSLGVIVAFAAIGF